MTKITQFTPQAGKHYVKIHGLQRTGTNYLAMLLKENLKDTEPLVNVGGWKHGHYCAPWVLNQEVHVLTITKNPYAWLSSLYNYWSNTDVGPDLTGVSFDQFVRNKVEFERQGGIPFLYRARNPVLFWNDMNFHWLSVRLNEKKSLAVPYETLLLDAEGVIKAIAEEFGLEPEVAFVNTWRKFVPGEEEPKTSPDEQMDFDYYLKERFLDRYSPELIAFVNSQLAPDVMATLGYALVSEERVSPPTTASAEVSPSDA